MDFKSKKAFIFDMDGTIIDNVPYHVMAWKEFSKRYGNELDEQQIVGWMGMTNRAYQERILGRKVEDGESQRLGEEKEVLYRDLFRPHLKLVDGLREVLDDAKARGVKLAIASGAPRGNVDFIMDGLDLRADFPVIIDDTQYVQGKPDPECYLTAAKRLGVAPKDCVVFEDAVLGIQAGKAAGMTVVALALRTAPEVLRAAGADLVIDSFLAVRNAFRHNPDGHRTTGPNLGTRAIP